MTTGRNPNKIFSFSQSDIINSVGVSEDNFLSPTRFQLVFDNPDLKGLSFHCQTMSLPSISLPNVEMPYGAYTAQFSGDRLQFEALEATFMVDENLKNFKAIMKWLTDQATQNTILKRDLAVLIYSNANSLIHTARFVGAIPTSLSPIAFASNTSDTTYMASSVSFSYDYYYFD